MQNTEILFSCKNLNLKIFDIFDSFVQNIDCGDSYKYPHSMFWNKNKKRMLTPRRHHFHYLKVGYKGYSLHGLQDSEHFEFLKRGYQT